MFLLHHLKLKLLLGLLARLCASGAKPLLNALLDCQVHLALCVVQLALLADQLGLGFLGLGELRFSLIQDFLKLSDLLGLLIKVGRQGKFCLLSFIYRDLRTLLLQFLGDLVVYRFLRLGDGLLTFTQRCLAIGNVNVLLGQALLVVAAGRFDKRSRKRLCQLDLGLAVRTGDRGFCHGQTFFAFCLVIGTICTT